MTFTAFFDATFYFQLKLSIILFRGNIFNLIIGLIVEQVTRFSPHNKSVNLLKSLSASNTDCKTSRFWQIGTGWDTLVSCPKTTWTASCCSTILFTISTFEYHHDLVHTSPFSFSCGKPFCTFTSLKSLCLFQLLENAATTFRHTDNACSILLSFKLLLMARSKLWPKQLNLFHLSSWHASFVLLALSVIIAVS